MRRAIAVEDPGELALPRFLDLLLEVGALRCGGLSDSAAPPPHAEAIS